VYSVVDDVAGDGQFQARYPEHGGVVAVAVTDLDRDERVALQAQSLPVDDLYVDGIWPGNSASQNDARDGRRSELVMWALVPAVARGHVSSFWNVDATTRRA